MKEFEDQEKIQDNKKNERFFETTNGKHHDKKDYQ